MESGVKWDPRKRGSFSLAGELYVIRETVANKAGKGISLADVTSLTMEQRTSGGVAVVPVLTLETRQGRMVFSGDSATDLYKELRKLAIVVT